MVSGKLSEKKGSSLGPSMRSCSNARAARPAVCSLNDAVAGFNTGSLPKKKQRERLVVYSLICDVKSPYLDELSHESKNALSYECMNVQRSK